MNIKEREKEFEEIKWQYWNKSKFFKIFWRHIYARKLYPSAPFPELIKELKNKNKPYAPAILEATREYWFYFLHHKPKNADFTEYWKHKEEIKRVIEDIEREREKNKVEYCKDLIPMYIDIIFDSVKRQENRVPTIGELKEYLTVWLTLKESVYLKINQYKFTDKEADKILIEVGKILKDRTDPIKKDHHEPLKKYLFAWELKHEQSKETPEIADILFKTEKTKSATKIRKANLYIKNAEEIIESLETGN